MPRDGVWLEFDVAGEVVNPDGGGAVGRDDGPEEVEDDVVQPFILAGSALHGVHGAIDLGGAPAELFVLGAGTGELGLGIGGGGRLVPRAGAAPAGDEQGEAASACCRERRGIGGR